MKKPKIKRILAAYIDIIICFFVFYIPLNLLSVVLASNENLLSILSIIAVIFICITYILKDLAFKNKSLGKKILNLSICDEEGIEITDKILLIKRNVITAFIGSLYPFMILINNKSLGDYIYNTMVTKKISSNSILRQYRTK